MATTPPGMEWYMPPQGSRTSDNLVRCFSVGMGSNMQGHWTGGLWSELEKTWHINCLAIQGAGLTVQTFLRGQSGMSVLLQMDSTTAVAYVNNLGGRYPHS